MPVRRRTVTLTQEQQGELTELRDHDPGPDVRERCAAVLKVAAGQSAYAVAKGGLLRPRDVDTLYQWLDFFQEEGVKGLIARRHGGPRRRCL